MILYRGINVEMHKQCNGQLCAKGTVGMYEILAGNDHVLAGNSYTTIDTSEENAAYLHNVDSDCYKTSYISCTTDIVVAKKFATEDGYSDGFIYTLDIPNINFQKITRSDHNAAAKNSHEAEVLLNLKSFGFVVPAEWIVDIESVKGKFTQ